MTKTAIIIGATGKIGREICRLIEPTHTLIRVGRSSGDVQVDYTDEAAVDQLFDQTGAFDVLVCSAGGDSVFKHHDELNDDDYRYGFERKFLAQTRLVRLGQAHANDGASITLSSGFLSDYTNPFSAGTGTFNAAIDAYVRTVGPLMERSIRLNVVSPAPVVEPGDDGLGRITAAQAAEAYHEAITGDMNGTVLRPWGGLPTPSGPDDPDRAR